VEALTQELLALAQQQRGPPPKDNFEPLVVQRANRVADCRMRRQPRVNSPQNLAAAAAAAALVPLTEEDEASGGAFRVVVCSVDGSVSASAGDGGGGGGAGVPLLVKPHDSVETVKLRIQRQLGMPADMQQLIWNGRLLGDDAGARAGGDGDGAAAAAGASGGEGIAAAPTVRDLGLRADATLHLVLRVRPPPPVEVCPEKLSDNTLRGRDWLEDRVSDDGQFRELRFEFGLCARPHARNAPGVEWEEVGPPEALARLGAQLEAVRAAALTIRRNAKRWEAELKEAHAAARDRLLACAADVEAAVAAARREARSTRDVRPVVLALLDGRRRVEQAKCVLICS
jgi:hypothetical protein